ncbi:bifunctional 4-hydroxy-2-oxoglutarate aldolase/2-dehydro-3-deoxy-phosphogluconate aldolase [Sansalvadorimonas verongulae]|uniref:bifunctional 4-hydroxy-2-oxoglutarate aldolase/2-dehydro-3-deoxy-phosphogluconate aldolase n=1 Tax=Sansalvadorimonas verongulae TaxID=2172824 RepID=UPI0012BBA062|nr:bifunctional 4-hydroxy-2-oxoglutarate aldolase/2-dehydro-3-deoxy-phosphogluconate aldolase [Sansalvadorimonas verongulae]MTI15179.1 bifunctional 4-hydroxy-2-oxoglutarate aldolase/2-dehydro-3-deoxy-phosphogluconate aldolase [Sansalvadorimonas verongulae]
MKDELQEIIDQAQSIIPLMVIDSLEQALPMAQALKDGGLTVFEVTLRTACALDAIKLLKKNMPECSIGAGTVINTDQFQQVAWAGGDFIVSPGMNDDMINMAQDMAIPFIPGVATPSDVMTAVNAGFEILKFFPAEQYGGATALKALAGPFREITFCPSGGININNAPDYLALPNVTCVSGSWIFPKDAVARNDWGTITELAREASKLNLSQQ